MKSAEWVGQQLKVLPCLLHNQTFIAPTWAQHSTPSLVIQQYNLAFQNNIDFVGLRYGGSGDYHITSKLHQINNFGCNSSDFVGLEGEIAFIPSGSCTIFTKAFLAQGANASAVIIYNTAQGSLPGSRVLPSPWFEGDPLVTVPVFGVSFSVGNYLREISINNSWEVLLRSNTTIYTTPTQNLFCDTPGGDPNSTIILGAHLDSVEAGPGINDNGSGSATVLELAIQWFATGLTPKNRIRFAWWGAEEEGLLGSRNYLRYLEQHDQAEFNTIALGLNLDMVGSPNFIPMIGKYSSDPSVPTAARNGSNYITKLFMDHYASIEAQHEFIEMTAGSDHYAFIEKGIPAGRIHSGAAQKKDIPLKRKYGGLINAIADTCYHQSCDDLQNFSSEILDQIPVAMASVLQTLANLENLREKLREGAAIISTNAQDRITFKDKHEF
uniref:Peptidase M28 domain-containing protein n=1 Tax=Arcella intermedia TaxID=1963864 RepID=A0A6B2L366_9EUKA